MEANSFGTGSGEVVVIGTPGEVAVTGVSVSGVHRVEALLELNHGRKGRLEGDVTKAREERLDTRQSATPGTEGMGDAGGEGGGETETTHAIARQGGLRHALRISAASAAVYTVKFTKS